MILRKTCSIILFMLFVVNQQLISQSCNVEGGIISTENSTIVCSGDEKADVVEVTLTNNTGDFSIWLITDDSQNILLTSDTPSFNFEGFESDVVLIYHASHDGSPQFTTGLNISDITDCFDLSNPISIVINHINGGLVFDENNSTIRTVCVGDGITNTFNLMLQDEVGDSSKWIITDENGIILELPVTSTFDFEGASPGTCFIYNVSFLNIQGLQVGNSIHDLIGCFDLSNPYNVVRTSGTVAGGNITTSEATQFCSGDGKPDKFSISLSGEIGDNSVFIIADFFNNIIGLQTSTEFEIEGINEENINIWHLSYLDNLRNLNIGRNFSELQGCFNFSNPISISIEYLDGGVINNINGPNDLVFCTDDGKNDMVAISQQNAIGSSQIFLITTEDGTITDITGNTAFNFEGDTSGTCIIYNLSYNTFPIGLDVGLNMQDITGCFSLSNPITIVKLAGPVNNVTISTSDDTFICTGDGISDFIDVNLEGSPLSKGSWVITDEDSTILDIPLAPPFDFTDAPSGICRIFYIDYISEVQGIDIGNNLNSIKGCFELSNEITINRSRVDGGRISLNSGDTTLLLCVGNSGSNILPLRLNDASGTNSRWVITEGIDSITFISEDENIDFNQFQTGTCKLWHLSYQDGLLGLVEGDSLSNLLGCYDLSNPIEIEKQEGITFPGTIFTSANTTVCVGDGSGDNIEFDELPGVGSHSRFLVIDDGGKILRVQLSSTIFMDDYPGGTCQVRNIRYEDGIIGLEVGNNISDLQGCFSISNSISIIKNEVSGGALGIKNENGVTAIICQGDGNNSSIILEVENQKGDEFRYIVTDGSGNISEIKLTPEFNFENESSRSLTIWHIGYESGLQGLEIGGNINQLNGCYDISNPVSLEILQVNGGEIQTVDGLTSVDICTGEDVNNLIEVKLDNEVGNRRTWMITNNTGIIIDLPTGPVFDFEDEPTGVCFIYNLSYVNFISNLEIGNSISDLEGCFSLSNGIQISKSSVDGGTLSINGNDNFLALCAGDSDPDLVQFDLNGQSGPAVQFLILDNEGKILEIYSNPVKDFNSYSEGLYNIRAVVFFNIDELFEGRNIDDLTGCYTLSNEVRIRIDRPEGGSLSNDQNQTSMEICVGEGVIDFINVKLSNVTGENSKWFITDGSGTILENNINPPFNLENAGTGVCKIYHVSYYDALTGTGKGLNLSGLTGCYNISNSLTVTRKKVSAGQIKTPDDAIEKTICVDDNLNFNIDLLVEGNEGENEIWVVTDTMDRILNFQSSSSFGFDDAGEGVCLVYHISYNGELMNLQADNPLDTLEGCFLISNSFRINRVIGESCTTSTVEINGKEYSVDIFPNPASDQLSISTDIPLSSIRNIIITSIDGKSVRDLSPLLLHSPIDVSYLPPGLNLLSIQLQKDVITVRFIKK